LAQTSRPLVVPIRLRLENEFGDRCEFRLDNQLENGVGFRLCEIVKKGDQNTPLELLGFHVLEITTDCPSILTMYGHWNWSIRRHHFVLQKAVQAIVLVCTLA
jgi:hypothetical protein